VIVALLALFVALLHWGAAAYNLFAWVAYWLLLAAIVRLIALPKFALRFNWGCGARIGIRKKRLFEEIR
jgi:hypothetical protein